MKKFLLSFIFMPFFIFAIEKGDSHLQSAPEAIEQFNEIATRYCAQLPDLFNSLTPQERIVVYFLHRAMLPGNRINVDQTHRHGVQVLDIFETIYENMDE